jgi:hypothetical protein
VEPVKAVDEINGIAVGPEDRPEAEEAQGPGPDVIGREIVNPGVDQKEAGRVGDQFSGTGGK